MNSESEGAESSFGPKCQRADIDESRRTKPTRCRRRGRKTFHINLGGIAISVILCDTCAIALEREQAERMAGHHPAVPKQRRSQKAVNRARRAAATPALQRKISSRAEIPAHMRLARIEKGRRDLEKVHATWREDDFEEALLEELSEKDAPEPQWIEEELEACGVNPRLLSEEYQEAQAILRSQGIKI